MRTIAIDPGTRTGWAAFDDGRLSACGAWIGYGDGAMGCWELSALLKRAAPDVVVAEVPRIYPMRRSKGDPNDLIQLACLAGAAVAVGRCCGRFVEPRLWKGTIPKPEKRADWTKYIVHKRVLPILDETEASLYLAEAPVGRLDMIDAVGLGLWHLKRLAVGAGQGKATRRSRSLGSLPAGDENPTSDAVSSQNMTL